ncbi:ankyrin, partial [Piromyces finnis]
EVTEKDKNKNTPLHIASKYGNNEMVHLLIEKDEELVNIQNNEKWTPLHFACDQGHNHKGVIEYLIEKYESMININLRSNEGKTVLHISCQNKNKDIVNLLLENGADI